MIELKRKTILIILAFVIIAVLAFMIMINRTNSNLEALAGQPLAHLNLAEVNDGKYNGSYQAFPVSAEVTVTVENHHITGIELVEHNHGQGAPGEKVIDQVLQDQTLQVDLVSGATYSSKVILLAIEDAFKRNSIDQ